MKDTDPERQASPRPAWVGEQAADVVQSGPRREKLPRRPVPGRHEDDGLWEHATEIGGLVTLATFIAAAVIPHDVPLWQLTFMGAAVTVVTGWVSLSLSGSGSVAAYLTAWGAGLTAWFTAARLAGPWHGMLIACLLLMAAVMIPVGVTVIRKHRDRVKRVAETGRDNMNVRECLYWQNLLATLGVPHVDVRDVIKVDGGYEVHCRLKKAVDGRQISSVPDEETVRRIRVHKRLQKGSVYIQEEPAGATGGSADFIIGVRTDTGPRLTRYLPAENSLLSVNRQFALGVHDTGREFTLRLREVVVFICGVIGSGKSTLMNVFVAQLARMPDVLVFMIDLKGGQEARAWVLPWLRGLTDRPVIDWLATTRAEADVMLDALKRAGAARARHPRYGKKLHPSPDAPQIVVICDETTVMTGHLIREDGLSNTQLATKLLQVAETYRSVAIVPVVSSVRAVVENTGKSGLKAMSSVRIGMRVESAHEGQQIFPDNLAAAKQLAQLKDKGMGIPKVGAELSPPVHFYNITDGTLDDDGHPTEDRITPIAVSCGARERRPKLEQLVIDAMGEAYAKRWDQPDIKQLTADWLAGSGEIPVLPAPLPAGPPLADDDPFDDIVSAFRSELDSLDEGNDSSGLHPARKRMRQLLIGRGRQGWARGLLWNQLLTEGFEVAQETVSRWLAADEKAGYVIRTGKPRSRWVWRLPEGAEFDIPGMDG